MLYHVVRIGRDPLDTFASTDRSEAIDLAMPDEDDVVECATVEAPDAGAARLAVPAGAWRTLKASALLLALTFSSAALSAASAPCKTVHFKDGGSGRFRETKTGFSRCAYVIDMVHVNGPGLPPVKVTKATPDACRVEILEKGMDAARVVAAHSACVDASHAAAEKEVTTKGGAK